MVTFFCWVAVVGLAAAFVLALFAKWGWIEWAQVHAPNDFMYKLLTCHFCSSWWACLGVSLVAFAFTEYLPLLAVPFLATMITVRLW